MIYSNNQFTGVSALFKIDVKLFMLVLTVVIIGLSTLFSVSGGDYNLLIKQLLRITIGMIAMIFLAQIHPDNIRLLSPFLYIFGIILSVSYTHLTLPTKRIV